MIPRWPLRTAVLTRTLLASLCLLLGWSAGAQDAAPADRNTINTRAHPGDMMADSPVTFPKEGALPAKHPPDVRAQDEPAEKDYYIFSSPCRSLAQIAEIQAAMPKGQFTPPAADWRPLRHTRQILTEGGELRLLALGDSIVNDTMRSGWVAKLAEAYPKAQIQATVYVRGGGGCQHFKELDRIATHVITRRPNLVVIGGISHRDIDSIREVIHQLRAGLPEVEILLATGAFGTTDPRDPEALAKAPHSGTGAYGRGIKNLAAEESCAYLDMTTPWAEYIRSARVHPHLFYRDVVHANEYGEQILSKILLAFWTAAESQDMIRQTVESPFKPDWMSLHAHRDPEWFRDAKFGIYTHWGPVTVGCEDAPQGGEWYGREMYLTNDPIFAWHRQKFGEQNTFGYKDLIPRFTASKFDPEKWADLFVRAGAKFAGPVAVHHDNFAMWDSAVTPWNSMKMGPKRDVTGELAKAYRARGLKLITTFHHGFAWRYYEPAFQFDAADGRNFQLYTEPHGPKDPPSQRFQEQWLAMVMEVVRHYQPDMIWFDFELNEVITPEYQRRMFADYYNWAAAQGKESAVAHKFREIHQHTGILDFERGREDRLVPYPWLTDTALGPWFNRKADPYRSAENLIQVLADIVAKNGCLLLNVGPNADGSIPERAERLLIEMGAWLKVNGEAIYGTRPWLGYGEGPTRSGGGGFSEGTDRAFSAQDIRFTTKGDALYAITLGWPGREFTLKAVRADSANSDARVELLGRGPVAHQINAEQQIVIDAPALTVAQLPCQHAYSFKLTGFKTSLHPSARFEQPGAIRLEPAEATCEGSLRLQVNEGRPNIGYWDAPGDRLHWLVPVKTAGRYLLRGEFSSAYGPSELKVTVAGQSRSAEVPKSDGWFRPLLVSFGEFQFDRPGVFHLVLEPAAPEHWRAVNVYQSQLAKIE